MTVATERIRELVDSCDAGSGGVRQPALAVIDYKIATYGGAYPQTTGRRT